MLDYVTDACEAALHGTTAALSAARADHHDIARRSATTAVRAVNAYGGRSRYRHASKQVRHPCTRGAKAPHARGELPRHPGGAAAARRDDADGARYRQAHFAPLAQDVTDAQTDNGKLGDTIQAEKNGGEAEKQAMLAAEKVVRQDVREIVPMVQGILRNVPPDQVPAILANILMFQSHVGERPPKAPLAADDPEGGRSGSVLLVALAILGALTYEYEWSANQVTWTVGRKSGKTRFILAGLTPGKQYWFRMTAFLRDGTTTQPVFAGPHIVR